MDKIKNDNKLVQTLNTRYTRESRNVNFDLMINTSIFFVGTGASGPMIEQFNKIGIKRLFLFDLDIVEINNLTSQNFTVNDIGLNKAEALKCRLESCEFERGNPDIPALEVKTYGDFLAISDDEINSIIAEEKAKGQQVILVLASDYHPVQARGNRIAKKFDIPVFWVGIYRMGKAGEIIFYIPGNDLPCYRCITETRYQFFDKNHLANHLENDYSGSGRSSGLPMAATFIDSILAHLIIGFIHSDVEDNQHGKLFRRLLGEKRNFIQCQLDPEYMLNGDEDIFPQIQGPDMIAFNTIFQHEERSFNCIDCHYKNIWEHTDYTKENYRLALEKFSEWTSAFMHGGVFHHPLLSEYDGFFADWEKHMAPE